jgi:hypothetical protein
MNLSSEQVHWVGGVAVLIVAIGLLLHDLGVLSARGWRWLLPIFLVLYGLESFMDPWIHGTAAPANYGGESAQHIVQGTAMLGGGFVEGLVLLGVVKRRAWSLAVSAAFVVLAVVFLVHDQHAVAVPQLVLDVQHRVFALTLFLAAAVRAMLLFSRPAVNALGRGWLVLFLLFGLELLTYTEGGSASAQHPAAEH